MLEERKKKQRNITPTLTFAPPNAIVAIWLLSPHSPKNVNINAWANTGEKNSEQKFLVDSFTFWVVHWALTESTKPAAEREPVAVDDDLACAPELVLPESGWCDFLLLLLPLPNNWGLCLPGVIDGPLFPLLPSSRSPTIPIALALPFEWPYIPCDLPSSISIWLSRPWRSIIPSSSSNSSSTSFISPWMWAFPAGIARPSWIILRPKTRKRREAT